MGHRFHLHCVRRKWHGLSGLTLIFLVLSVHIRIISVNTYPAGSTGPCPIYTYLSSYIKGSCSKSSLEISESRL